MEKVVVAITTYNLERYIAQALESILRQKTIFPFKILVADDCSTDNTLSILYGFERKYPDIIKVLPSKKNLGSLANSNRLFDGLNAEYFTFLDGDDYWLDEKRLQDQVDFLDTHPEYSMCGGNTQFLRDDVLCELLLSKTELNKSYSFSDLISGSMPFIHTSSLLVRNTIFNNGLPHQYMDAVGTFEECALRGEDFRRLIHLQRGPVFLMDRLFSVYRIHSKGLWQGSSSFKKQLEGAIADNFYGKFFGEEYGPHFKGMAVRSYRSLMFSLLLEQHSKQAVSDQEYHQLAQYMADYSRNNYGAPRNNLYLKFFKKFFSIINRDIS